MSLYHIEQANLPLEIIQLLSFLSSLLSLQANREREREREKWFEEIGKTLLQVFRVEEGRRL